jgi:hypothetical protein
LCGVALYHFLLYCATGLNAIPSHFPIGGICAVLPKMYSDDNRPTESELSAMKEKLLPEIDKLLDIQSK